MSKDTNKNLEIQKKQEKFGGKEYIYQGHKTGLREFDAHFDACRCNKCNNKALISVCLITFQETEHTGVQYVKQRSL